MDKLPEIKASYDWFFARYQSETAERARSGDIAAIDRMELRRDILERAVFVLMFGQFEKAVNSKFEEAVNARITNPDWNSRRGWDTPSLRGNKVPFDTRLAMVLDSQSPSFRRVLQTYATRNHCAHGGTTNAVGSIDALEADLYRWQSELRT
ncbi:hypothetical protein [Rhodopseudomonas palustris]|uniref:hypothetical protein n=1 Tax=Rhodopseudomonas palustris TaxID=1076 RepID=UPI000E5C3D86|nr:hypothetical protein [Rhodopseudomonas palustris]QLH73015.1 hypothetical protein HZF03_20290 [Rhodopseudomonas palustris]RHZ90918.1 hypothetical protein D1920_23590 [Rhodopseudomonas palustris]